MWKRCCVLGDGVERDVLVRQGELVTGVTHPRHAGLSNVKLALAKALFYITLILKVYFWTFQHSSRPLMDRYEKLEKKNKLSSKYVSQKR